MLNEFYRVAFRKKIYTSLDALQVDLDAWLAEYNATRPHQGRWCYGKTPRQPRLTCRRLGRSALSGPGVHACAGARLRAGGASGELTSGGSLAEMATEERQQPLHLIATLRPAAEQVVVPAPFVVHRFDRFPDVRQLASKSRAILVTATPPSAGLSSAPCSCRRHGRGRILRGLRPKISAAWIQVSTSDPGPLTATGQHP